MRLAFWISLLAVTAAAADLKIDHVTACGADVKAMQAALKAVGLSSEYGGPHANKVSEMALASFADGSYLELIAIQRKAAKPDVSAHEWGAQMQNNAGPCAWAARTNDMKAEIARLTTLGTKVSKPQPSGRNRPDGVRLDWETAQVGDRPRGVYFPFLIHDFTPREQRAFPRGRPTATEIAGVSRVVIAVNDLHGAARLFRKTFALVAPIEQGDPAFGASLAIFSDTPVVLATPLNSRSWLATRIQKFGEGPVAIVLNGAKSSTLRTNTTSQWLGKQISWVDPALLGWRLGVE